MISITSDLNVLVAIPPVDFRQGIDGLGGICRQKLNTPPQNKNIFVFRNKSCTAIRILFYDGLSYWLLTRRLSAGRLAWWPSEGDTHAVLKSSELKDLIIDLPSQITRKKRVHWKKI